jgi:hypothetical protein
MENGLSSRDENGAFGLNSVGSNDISTISMM